MEQKDSNISDALKLLNDQIRGRDLADITANLLLVSTLNKSNSIDLNHYLSLLDKFASEGLDSQPDTVNEHMKPLLANLASSIRNSL